MDQPDHVPPRAPANTKDNANRRRRRNLIYQDSEDEVSDVEMSNNPATAPPTAPLPVVSTDTASTQHRRSPADAGTSASSNNTLVPNEAALKSSITVEPVKAPAPSMQSSTSGSSTSASSLNPSVPIDTAIAGTDAVKTAPPSFLDFAPKYAREQCNTEDVNTGESAASTQSKEPSLATLNFPTAHPVPGQYAVTSNTIATGEIPSDSTQNDTEMPDVGVASTSNTSGGDPMTGVSSAKTAIPEHGAEGITTGVPQPENEMFVRSAGPELDMEPMNLDQYETPASEPEEGMFVASDDEAAQDSDEDSMFGGLPAPDSEKMALVTQEQAFSDDEFDEYKDSLNKRQRLSSDEASPNKAVTIAAQREGPVTPERQSHREGTADADTPVTGQKRKLGRVSARRLEPGTGALNSTASLQGRLLSSPLPTSSKAAATGPDAAAADVSSGSGGGLPMPRISIGQAAPVIAESQKRTMDSLLPMPSLVMPEQDETDFPEPESAEAAQAAMLMFMCNAKANKPEVAKSPENPVNPFPSSLGEMPGDPSIMRTNASKSRGSAMRQGPSARPPLDDGDVEMAQDNDNAFDDDDDDESYEITIRSEISELRGKVKPTGSELARLWRLEEELSTFLLLATRRTPEVMEDDIPPNNDWAERQKAYDAQNQEAEAAAEALIAQPKRKHLKTARDVHERNQQAEEARAAKQASKRRDDGEDTENRGRSQAKKHKLDKVVKQMVKNLLRSDTITERLAQGDDITETTFKASTKEQQLKQLLASVPEDFNTGQAKNERAELNRASKSFGYGMIKAVDGKWLLKGMKTSMYHHQLLAANWLIAKELASSEPHGGLLADAMGLGKTVTSLAAMVGNRPHKNDPRATLIVAPASMVGQWKDEIAKHCHPETFPKVLIYNAPTQMTLNIIADCDIVITTYNAVMRSYRAPSTKEDKEEIKKEGIEAWFKKNSHRSGGLHQILWYRIILDEAQAIKNHTSLTAQACFCLQGKYRTLLTGTPMQNNLEELYPYFKFLNCQYTKTFAQFNARFKEQNYESSRRLAVLLMLYMKRRTNGDRILGKPLIVLPPIKAKLRMIKLTPQETVIYRLIEERYRELVNEQLKNGTFEKNRGVHLGRIVRLRQAASHTFLLEPLFKSLFDADAICYLREKLKSIGKRDTSAVYHQIKEWANRKGDTQQAFGKGSFGSRFNMTEFLSSPGQKKAAKSQTTCPICSDVPDRPVITDCSHIFCQNCIYAEMMKQESDLDGYECPRCRSIFEGYKDYNEDDVEPDVLDANVAFESPAGKQSYQWRPHFEETEWFQMCSEGGNELIPSAKTIAVKAQILRWQDDAPNDKILIFTQFLAMTKIIGMICQQEGWGHVYFTGEMTLKQRRQAVEALHHDDSVKIMIAVLKCGGVGLNLTAANRCINIDPWWNHHVEQQALGRIFRIGQQKTTYFTRIVAKDTVDIRMLDMQKEKMELIEEALDKGNFNTKDISIEEIANLFGKLETDEEGKSKVVADYDDDDDDDELSSDDEGEIVVPEDDLGSSQQPDSSPRPTAGRTSAARPPANTSAGSSGNAPTCKLPKARNRVVSEAPPTISFQGPPPPPSHRPAPSSSKAQPRNHRN